MPLDLDNLKKSIYALERSLHVATSEMDMFNEDVQNTLRAGVIQNFEVAYEQCWKYIQRWIKINRSQSEAEQTRTRKDIFRMAAKAGLINDPLLWFEYSDARNLTSLTYDESQAKAVFEIAGTFLTDAKYLHTQLEQHND